RFRGDGRARRFPAVLKEYFSYGIPIPPSHEPSRFFTAICPFYIYGKLRLRQYYVVGPTCDDRLGRVHERIRHARTVTPELVSDFIEAEGIDPALPRGSNGRLAWLIEAGARTEAVLALIDIAVPQWKLLNLAYDDGEWHCSLSRQRGVPAEFDDTADGHHENLALAIMARSSRRAVSVRPCRGARCPLFAIIWGSQSVAKTFPD